MLTGLPTGETAGLGDVVVIPNDVSIIPNHAVVRHCAAANTQS